ncbi:MAG: hypothetical protein GX947_01750 [Tissierellia bacterium]|nr:hypothetical protein [Tissierellia bacterium]
MNKEDRIFDLLEKLYVELQDARRELKDEIQEAKTDLEDTKKELKTDIKTLSDNQMKIFDKLENIAQDII